jgi:hypothetical protein
MSAGHEPDVNFGCSLDGGKTWQPTSAPPSEESEELDAATKKSGMHHPLFTFLFAFWLRQAEWLASTLLFWVPEVAISQHPSALGPD